MNKKALIIHITICLIIGGIISHFTSAKWLAASFWISAALNINGSLAHYKDARTGGFENLNGKDTPEFAKGIGAIKFLMGSIVYSIPSALPQLRKNIHIFIQCEN